MIDKTAKINSIDTDSYRKLLQILQNNKCNFHIYNNKQSRPICVMAKNLHLSCKLENTYNQSAMYKAAG